MASYGVRIKAKLQVVIAQANCRIEPCSRMPIQSLPQGNIDVELVDRIMGRAKPVNAGDLASPGGDHGERESAILTMTNLQESLISDYHVPQAGAVNKHIPACQYEVCAGLRRHISECVCRIR
jgi:hypothetical protein